MFEGNRRMNRFLKRSYYRYFYLHNGMKVGEQVVTKSGKDTPRWGGKGYPRPTKPDQIALVVDNLESWVLVNVNEWEPLSTTMPEWKKEGKGYIPEKQEDGTYKMVEVNESTFVKHWQHFDPSVIISFVESKVVQLFLKGKENKWEALAMPLMVIGSFAFIFLTVYVVISR